MNLRLAGLLAPCGHEIASSALEFLSVRQADVLLPDDVLRKRATYFLRTCPGVKMDGNNDGVPCEQPWCR